MSGGCDKLLDIREGAYRHRCALEQHRAHPTPEWRAVCVIVVEFGPHPEDVGVYLGRRRNEKMGLHSFNPGMFVESDRPLLAEFHFALSLPNEAAEN